MNSINRDMAVSAMCAMGVSPMILEANTHGRDARDTNYGRFMNWACVRRGARIRKSVILALLGLSVMSIFCSGCGYSMDTPYRRGISTIAVPMWQRGSKVFYRDVEIRLTQALVKTIQAETPYRIVDRSKADTMLEGTLVNIDQYVLSFNPLTGNAREIELRLTVDFTWKDLRTGKILAQKKNFRATSTFIPPEPFDETMFLATEDALGRLALKIVEQMGAPW